MYIVLCIYYYIHEWIYSYDYIFLWYCLLSLHPRMEGDTAVFLYRIVYCHYIREWRGMQFILSYRIVNDHYIHEWIYIYD